MTGPTDRTSRRTAPGGDSDPDDDLRDDLRDDAADDDADDVPEEAATAARGGRARKRGRLDFLYEGNGGLDVIGRRKTWYLVFGAILAVCVLSMVFRGFNFGIDFVGGTTVQFPAQGAGGVADTSQVEQAYTETLGRSPSSVQTAGTGPTATVLIRSERLTEAETIELRQVLFDRFQPLGATGAPDPQAVSDSQVSASWGGEITQQALIALAVFLVLVSVYLIFYFEWKMAVASLVTLIYDIAVTAGVYSLVGLEVSPATVIGLLTILGYSLYDTVITFDKVRENVRGLESLTRRTYAEAANLAVNQTLMRSLNTSLTSALPLAGLFVIGVGLLGVGVLGDLALVQLVGTLIGTVSSIVIATPVLVDLADRDPVWIAQAKRVAARRAKVAARRGADGGVDGESASERTDALDGREVAAAVAGAPSGGAGRAARPRADGAGPRPAGKSGRPTGKRRR